MKTETSRAAPITEKRLNWLIIEDGLKDFHGHFLDFVTTFVRGLKALGDGVTVLCARGATATVIEQTGARPIMPEARLRLGSLRKPLEMARHVYWVCASLIVLLRSGKLIDQSDVIFVTAAKVQHLVLWRLYSAFRGRRFQTALLLFFMATPIRKKATGASYEWDGLLGRAVGRLVKSLSSSQAGGRIRFATETEQLSACLSELCGVPFDTMPQPVEVGETSFSGVKAAGKKNVVTVGSFGPPREEKGSHLLIKALENMTSAENNVPAEFIVQWTEDFTCAGGDVAQIPAGLRRSERFTAVDHHFVPGEYERLLEETDAIILPYGPNYDLRGSRVLVDALVRGIPVAVTSGTSMEPTARRFGQCISITEWTQSAIETAIAELVARVRDLPKNSAGLTSSAREYFSVGFFRSELARSLLSNSSNNELSDKRFSDGAQLRAQAQEGPHCCDYRVLICGYYGRSNLGDDLLLLKVLEALPNRCRATIRAASESLDLASVTSDWAVLCEQTESLLSRVLQVLRHDALLFGGGGLFPNKKGSVGQYIELLAAMILGKRIVIAGISINPEKRGWERMLWRIIARRAAFLAVRDEESVQVFGDNTSRARVVLGPDLLLGGLPAQDSEVPPCCPQDNDYTIFVPAWFPAVIYGRGGDERLRKLALEFAAAMETSVSLGSRPLLVSFYPKDDEQILQKLAELVPAVSILRYKQDFHARHISCLMSQAKLCVCMRFHAFLAAVLYQRPSVVVSYDNKFGGLASSLGSAVPLFDYGISSKYCFGVVRDLAPGALAEAVRRQLDAATINNAVRYPELLQASASARDLLKSAIKKLA